jgi:DNA polymerase II large subunit DP2.
LNKIPTFDDALKLSLDFQISLHPQYLYFWDMISSQELSELLEPNKVSEKSIEYSIETKKILEKLGTPHKIDNEIIILEELEVKIFFNLLFRIKPTISDLSVPKIFIKIIRNSN